MWSSTWEETSKSLVFVLYIRKIEQAPSTFLPFFHFKLLLSYSRKLNLNGNPACLLFPWWSIDLYQVIHKMRHKRRMHSAPIKSDDHPVENQSGMCGKVRKRSLTDNRHIYQNNMMEECDSSKVCPAVKKKKRKSSNQAAWTSLWLHWGFQMVTWSQSFFKRKMGIFPYAEKII